jgi:hypothetical protein
MVIGFYFSIAVLGLVFAFHPMIFAGFQRLQTDEGDTIFNHYLLEHGYRWVTRWPKHLSFWDAPYFHPVPNVVAYSDAMLGSGPLYWLFRVIGISELPSYQLWLMSVLALDFVAMLWFLRDSLKLGRVGSAWGAFLFAFASMRVQQLDHQQLLPHFLTVLAIQFLVRAFRAQTAGNPRTVFWRVSGWLVAAALAGIAQLYTGFYLAWFAVVAVSLVFVWAWVWLESRRRMLEFFSKSSGWGGLVLAAAFFGIAAWPLVTHYLEAAKTVGVRDLSGVVGPEMAAWGYLGGGSWLYGWQDSLTTYARIPFQHEQRIGIGFIALPLALWGLRRLISRQAWIGAMAAAGLSLFVMTTRFQGGVSLWPFFFKVIPGAVAVRALSRVGLILLLPLSVGLASAVDTLVGWAWSRPASERGSIASKAVTVFLCAIVVLEQGRTTKSFDLNAWKDEARALSASVGPNCDTFYAESEPNPRVGVIGFQLQAIWAASMLGEREIPTINGYSGNQPPGWALYSDSPELQRQWFDHWVREHRLDPARTCYIGLDARRGGRS